VIIFGIASTQDVLACSGGQPSSINELIDYASVIVRGHIIAKDDSGQNAIMQVTEYLKGEGNEYILLGIISPSSIINTRLRFSGGGCFYGISALPQDREIVIFLNKYFDGTYKLGGSHHTNEDYYKQQPTIGVWEDRFGIRSYREVTFENFISIIQRIVGTAPILPTMNNPYPLRAPMVITTELGTKYILPIDKSPPILPSELDMYEPHLDEFLEWLGISETSCWTSGCRGRSNILLDRAQITHEGVGIEYTASPFSGGYTKGGKGFAFSPTNQGIIAVWKNRRTAIRGNLIEYETSIQIKQYEHPFMGFPLILEMPIQTDVVFPYSGAWSPRGRYLAYADTDGIYLWDVFTQNSSPELLIKTNHKMIHGFSPMGRFLMVGNEENGFSYRLQDGSTHPIGAFSPNDRILLPYQNPSQIIYFLPNYEVATIELPDELAGYHTEKIVWANNNRFYRLLCNMESCFMAGGDISHRVYTPHPLIEARNFDYDELNDQLVILRDDYHITITTPFTTLEYDLSDVLDSPIASIEWLPSLFYYES